MIQLTGAAKQFGGRILFSHTDWRISDRENIGLVGANGSGKSTLLKILAEIEPLDDGQLVRSKSQRVGYLPQEGLSMYGRRLLDECRSVFEDLLGMEQELRRLEIELSQGATDPAIANRYAELQHGFQLRGGFSIEARIGTVLAGLGFPADDLYRPCEEFSGGWQMRIALAKLLLAQPEILLLDEPTNHLDIEARNWLEDFLKHYPHTCVLVSHDRYFLDAVVNRIAELSESKLHLYTGNYSSYLQQKEQRIAQLQAAWENQQEKRRQLELFINRFRYTATKASQVQSRIKELERMEEIVLPEREEAIHFNFPQPPPSGKRVLELRGVEKSYGDKRIFNGIDLVLERGDRVALVGHNGAGKSTLIRLLSGIEAPDRGERVPGHEVVVDFFAQDQYKTLDASHRILDDITSVSPMMMAPHLRTLLGCFLFRGDDVYKRIGVLSGGERNRYALARMLLRPANFLLLDEPTNHLDLRAKDVLLDALRQFNGTVVFVSHDRAFIDGLATTVIEVGGGGIAVYPGNYEDYLYRKEHEGEAAEEAAAAETPASQPAAVEPTQAEETAAEPQRKRLNPQRRKQMEDAVQDLEEEIARREAALTELEAAMSSEETFRDPTRAQETMVRYQQQREDRDRLYAEWESQMAALDEA